MRRVRPARNLESPRARGLLLKRRIARWLPRHPGRFAGWALTFGILGFCGLAAADFADHGTRLSLAMLRSTAALGFSVQDIKVEGRAETTPDEILAAIGAARGTPILGISPERAKLQLEALPWVKSAAVERQLPNTLDIQLTERKPLALWQNQGKMALIDHDGVVVASNDLGLYSNLLLVVGPDAPAHAAALIDTLSTEPKLMQRVNSAVWISDRRWDLHLDNGIEVALPEDRVPEAWAHLAELDRNHGLMDRDIDRVDLRLADRVVVKLAPEPAKPGAAPAAAPHRKTAKST